MHCGIKDIEGKERKLRNLVFIETKESLGQSKIAVIKEHQRKKKTTSKMLAKVIETAKDFNAETALALAYNKNIVANRLLTKYDFKHEKSLYYELYSKEKQFIGDSVLAVFDLKQNLPSIKLNKNITVRRIENKDLVSMQEIFGECWLDVFGTNPSYAQIMDWYNSRWGELTLVSELSEQVVGCMEFTSLGVIGIPGVLKEYRNQKIGSALFYHLLLEMKNKNLEKAFADTGFILQEAINMYKKFNFDLSRELWAWFKVL
ncbi:MAG: GNAT family N-acetyltransferase [Candidatus Heimdallarchaeota archaeon]